MSVSNSLVRCELGRLQFLVSEDSFFLFATSQNHFLFNGKFYNQTDGAAMGSPLAPVLANIFMGFYGSKWLNEYNFEQTQILSRIHS